MDHETTTGDLVGKEAEAVLNQLDEFSDEEVAKMLSRLLTEGKGSE